MTLIDELAPCPFCGGEAVTEYDTGYWFAFCRLHSWCCTPKYQHEKDAIETWNRRAATKAEGAQAPVAWLIKWHRPDSIGRTQIVSFDQCSPDDGECYPLYTAPPSLPAQAPVAWLHTMCMDGGRRFTKILPTNENYGWGTPGREPGVTAVPLYTAPQSLPNEQEPDFTVSMYGSVEAADKARSKWKRKERGHRRVVCAAVLYPDGFIALGPRHFDATMHKQIDDDRSKLHHAAAQGFIDQWGAFMDRREAWQVAQAAGQVLFRCGGDETNGGTLYSENLY